MLRKIADGISAGILISIGGTIFLACKEDNKYIGAVLFSIALLCICIRGYSLYTGKIGYIVEAHKKENFSVLFLGLLGNLIATVICGYALRYALPGIGEVANAICTAKLAQPFWSALIRAIFCGILMYLAVDIYRTGKGVIGILFCIPVFILSGYEHSVANMYYFAASGIVSFEAFLYIMTAVLGNSIGSFILPLLSKFKEAKSGE